MFAWLIASAMFRAYTNKQLGKAGSNFRLYYLMLASSYLTSHLEQWQIHGYKDHRHQYTQEDDHDGLDQTTQYAGLMLYLI